MTDLAPYRPSKARPWSRVTAGHLLRRAGFAASEVEIQNALTDGPSATVDRLVNSTDESSRHDELDALGETLALRNDINALRGWWLLRMRHTNRPLHARLAVFWHDHFATSNVKVASTPLMYQQLRTLEQHALGRFADLLGAITRDPAMIVWLDGDSNIKGRPNENFARELFELFTLGVGNYTESDIQEAARAFTGFHQRRGRFQYVERNHDDGEKSLFGKTGRLGGDDIVTITMEHPACSRFIAGKLLREFLAPDPPDHLIASLAATLRQTDFDLSGAMKVILSSEAMFDPRWYRAHIKSPVEYSIGIARSLDLRIGAQRLAGAVADMGQRLLEPPSVKGWDGHRTWLNSATMLVRMNAALTAVSVDDETGFDPGRLRSTHNLQTREAVLRFCEDLTMDGSLPAPLRKRLDSVEGELDSIMRDALSVLMSSPEYQFA